VENYRGSPLYEEAFIRILESIEEPEEFFSFLKNKKKKFLKQRELKILYLKSNFERKRGNIKKAEKIEKLIIEKYPYSEFAFKTVTESQNKFPLKDIIKILYLHGKWNRILEILKKRETHNPEIIFYKAYSNFKLKRYEEALNYFKISLTMGFKNKERVNFYKALCYLYLGDTLKALNSFIRNLIYENNYKDHTLREMRIIYLSNKKYRKKIKSLFDKEKIDDEVIYFYFDTANTEKLSFLLRNTGSRRIFINYLKYLTFNDEKIMDEIHRESPLSYFSLSAKGLCIEKNLNIDSILSDSTFPLYDTLKLYLELKLEDDFWARVKKIKEPEKLLKISYFLNMDNYYYYSIITARKFYNIYRRDKKVCFDQKILNILFPLPFKDLITELSTKYDIDPTLVYAIIRRESLFDSTAVSPKGAKGLMQLMEKTAIKVNEGQRVNLFKVRENLETGIKYLKSLIDSFGLYYGICAYNAGEKSVKKWKKFVPENEVSIFFDIPYRETRKYLFYVLSDYLVYKLLYPELKLKI